MLFPLNIGYAKVDKKDYKKLADLGVWTLNAHGYAQRWSKGGRKSRHLILMHRLVLGLEDNPGSKTSIVADHINRCRLDNRKSNLRVVNRSINTRNSVIQNRQFLGTSFWKMGKYSYWRAVYKGKTLKYCSTREEAKKVYDEHVDMLGV